MFRRKDHCLHAELDQPVDDELLRLEQLPLASWNEKLHRLDGGEQSYNEMWGMLQLTLYYCCRWRYLEDHRCGAEQAPRECNASYQLHAASLDPSMEGTKVLNSIHHIA